MKTRNLLYILPIVALTACEPDIDDVKLSAGSADFSTVVAVGNSLTAGFQSNALSKEGQKNSLPAMIASQMSQVGGGAFTQPLIEGVPGQKGVGLNAALPAPLVLPELVLRVTPTGPSPQLASGPYDGSEFFTSIGADGPFNNVAVPGARVTHLNFPGYGSAQGNPYFARFASNGLETILQAAMRSSPTFFELWIGNNDVLGYSTTGGDEGGDAITPVGVFESLYGGALDSLMKDGAKGVVANIPYVTSIPYFTTVRWNALVLTQAQADALNGAFAGYNGALDSPQIAGQINDADEVASRKLVFNAGANGFLFLDTDLTTVFTDTSGTELPKFRQLVSKELITLTISQDDLRTNGLGSVNLATGVPNPITGEFVLDADEVSLVTSTVDQYNTYIRNQAAVRGLAFVDANARLIELSTTGIVADGISFSSAFISGGAFSLDAVHPSTRGYAIIANDFISAINRTYRSNIPKVNIGSYSTIETQP